MTDEERIIDISDHCFEKLIDIVGKPQENSILALDWAGIGDACLCARLILQHVVRNGKKVTWICVPTVSTLFKDDDAMRALPGMANPYRVPHLPNQMQVSHGINGHFERHFPEWEKLNISHSVMCRYYGHPSVNFIDRFFNACGMTRDMSVQHSLVHLGEVPKDLPGPYIVFEHTGRSHGCAHPDLARALVANLKNIGVSTVCVGGSDSFVVPGAIMRIGLNLYDTFSIMKGAIAMIGRSSGNQSLACFLPKMPLFEIDVPQVFARYNVCKAHPNVIEPDSHYPEFIPNYVRDKLLDRKEPA